MLPSYPFVWGPLRPHRPKAESLEPSTANVKRNSPAHLQASASFKRRIKTLPASKCTLGVVRSDVPTADTQNPDSIWFQGNRWPHYVWWPSAKRWLRWMVVVEDGQRWLCVLNVLKAFSRTPTCSFWVLNKYRHYNQPPNFHTVTHHPVAFVWHIWNWKIMLIIWWWWNIFPVNLLIYKTMKNGLSFLNAHLTLNLK